MDIESCASKDLFLNREIQWLEFNSRVLELAANEKNPLLERLRYLSIFESNLDEFFMKRVGGLKHQVEFDWDKKSLDGLDALEQVRLIRRKVIDLVASANEIFQGQVRPSLEKHSIHMVSWSELDSKHQKYLQKFFMKNIYPVVTPLVVDEASPFPFISNLTLSLGIKLRYRESGLIAFARVKVPEILPQWVSIPETRYFIPVIEVIEHNLTELFQNCEILKTLPFRVTRNADVEGDQDGAEDLVDQINEEIRQRRFADAVRLQVLQDGDPWLVDFLTEHLGLHKGEVYSSPSPIHFGKFSSLLDLPMAHLKFPPWVPVAGRSFSFPEGDFFKVLDGQDLLAHHPFGSFSNSVEKFVRAAVNDPKVLAIKMTLYRTDEKSPVVPLLIEAAEKGKQVVCLVEIKARFDEARNIFWAQKMENAGVHVIYGVSGLKTHCKTILVLRQNIDKIRAYTHIGSGNYNSVTAKLYTDVGLFTSRSEVTGEIVNLFHFLTSRSSHRKFDHLLVAPFNMRDLFLKKILREIDNHNKGKNSGIWAKFNSLEDPVIVRALYKASQAGVSVRLIVRGFCVLKPGVPGLSENIEVRSILGRFLEHSRIFVFQNGKKQSSEGEFYLGSADWMKRNLSDRVEVAVPITEPIVKSQLWEILKIYGSSEAQCSFLQEDGSYVPNPKGKWSPQKRLMNWARLQGQLLPTD